MSDPIPFPDPAEAVLTGGDVPHMAGAGEVVAAIRAEVAATAVPAVSPALAEFVGVTPAAAGLGTTAKVLAFAGTAVGKIVLTGALAAASVGGAHATGAVDVPLLPEIVEQSDPAEPTPVPGVTEAGEDEESSDEIERREEVNETEAVDTEPVDKEDFELESIVRESPDTPDAPDVADIDDEDDDSDENSDEDDSDEVESSDIDDDQDDDDDSDSDSNDDDDSDDDDSDSDDDDDSDSDDDDDDDDDDDEGDDD